MQLTKPIKKVEFFWDNKLSERQEQKLIACINEQEGAIINEFRNEENILVNSEDIETLANVYNVGEKFFKKENIKFSSSLKVSIIIEFPDEEAFDFMDSYFVPPYKEANFVCAATRFVCIENSKMFLISININDEKHVLIEASDLINNSEDLNCKYERAIATIHKVIKF